MKLCRLTALVLSVLLFLPLCACRGTSETPSASSVTVTDLIGRTVTVVPGSYRRIVCIGAGALRMYSYIGDISLLCGVEDIDNLSLSERPKMFDSAPRPYVLAYGDVFRTLPSCGVGGPNAQAAEAEKILSCDPDLVISEYGDTDKENALEEQLGVPVLTLKSGVSGVFAEDFLESLLLLGTVLSKEERAETLVSYIRAETAEISDRTADIPDKDKPSVYIAGLGNWGTANHLTTAENYSTFEIAHIKNAVSRLGVKGISTIEEEKFVSVGEKTDILFLDAAAVRNIRPLYAEDPDLFDSFSAWQTGEVYLQMAYNAYYTNYEIALANAWFLAKTVYPDRFSDINMTEKLDEITEMFLGKGLSSEIFACESSFSGYRKLDTDTFFG